MRRLAAAAEKMTALEWARESHALAVTEVYGRIEPEASVAMPYVDDTLPLVEERLLMAGVRLAATLNDLVGDGDAPSAVSRTPSP